MKKNNEIVEFQTNQGTFIVELATEDAPRTTENFLDYVNSRYYDNTLFHRVIPGFMVQGGGFDLAFSQKENKSPIENEANNELKNTIGTISMARTNMPHSATSQFFINVADNPFLDFQSETPDGYGYCVFGKIVQGMDIILNISKLATHTREGHQDVPCEDVFIVKAIHKQVTQEEVAKEEASSAS